MTHPMIPGCGGSESTTLQLKKFVLKKMDDLVAMAAEWCSFVDIARLRRLSTRCLRLLCLSDEWDRYFYGKAPSLEIQGMKSIPSRRRMPWTFPSKVPMTIMLALK